MTDYIKRISDVECDTETARVQLSGVLQGEGTVARIRTDGDTVLDGCSLDGVEFADLLEF